MRSVNSNNQRYRDSLDQAIKLRRKGQWKRSIELLQQVLQRRPNSAAAHGYLACIYFERSDFDRATNEFRTTAELNPRSEKASLGLFHSLWRSNRKMEVVAEMRRFLSISDSVEYGRLLHDLAVAGELVPQAALAHAV
jgi:Flp pilus assembly protein TadD